MALFVCEVMEVFTGKQLFDSFSGLSKSMDNLDHIAKGHIPCKKCGGIGWVGPPAQTFLKRWLLAFPFRVRFGNRKPSGELSVIPKDKLKEKHAEEKTT